MADELVSCTNGVCGLCDLLRVAGNTFFWLLTVAFILAVLLATISGLFYLFSFGRKAYMRLAKDALKYCLIGFLICLVAWLSIHSLHIMLGYKSSSWWKIDCPGEGPSSAETEKQKIAYPNEISSQEYGGRSNPISLPDLAKLELEDLPENKYFFIHGLGGQPIINAAKQLASVAEMAKKQGKKLFAVVPKSKLKLEISRVNKNADYQTVSLTDLVGLNTYQTQKNIRAAITDLIAKSPSSKIPLIISSSSGDLPEFSNIWPTDIDLSVKAASKNFTTITPEGVIYEENKVISEEEKAGSSVFTINLSYDEKLGKYYLNEENPVSFDFPQDVSPRSAKKAAGEIAQILAQSAKNSYYKDEDEWAKLADLMAKYGEDLDEGPEKEDGQELSGKVKNAYSPGIFPTGVVRDTNNPASQNSYNKMIADLEEDAAVIIKNELKGIRKDTNVTANKNSNSQSIAVRNQAKDDNFQVMVITPVEFTGTLEEVEKLLRAIPNYAVSDLKARISTNRILGLPEREKLKSLIVSVQDEIAYVGGIDLNIASDFIMCIFNKETRFDAGAVSVTGCSGLGQLSMGAAKNGMQELKKYAPKHFKALAEKVNQDWSEFTGSSVDMEATFAAQSNTDFKRVILRSDANLNAAFATGFIDYIRRGQGKGTPVSGELDLRRIAVRYGPGDTIYPNSIMVCYQNKGWRTIK